uniref:Uncharacterized protein n=1 Tax=Ditylenchus dipsaci TaxID=166011 RepID=A0A915D6D0_9BILA
MIALRERIFAVIGKFSKSDAATKALVRKIGEQLLFLLTRGGRRLKSRILACWSLGEESYSFYGETLFLVCYQEGEEQVCEEHSPVYSVFNFFGQDLRPKKQRANHDILF